MAIPVLKPNCYHQVKAHPSALVSPHASIMGDVTLGRDTTVLDGARLRADDAPILIGDETNIQENVVVHVDVDEPVVVGNHVTVGHRAILHSCTIGDNTLVGMGAIVMNRAIVGANSLVAAGAIVTEDKEFPDGCLIMGAPARVKRLFTEDEIALMCVEPADEYLVVRAALRDEGLLAHPEPGQRVFPAR